MVNCIVFIVGPFIQLKLTMDCAVRFACASH